MRKNLKIEHVADLFEKPTRLATLATHRADGSILLSPVGFLWEDGGFSIGTYTEAFHVRLIERDPRVSISVAEEEPPFRGLEIRGEAKILRGDEGARGMARVAEHFMGPEQSKVHLDPLESTDVVLLRIEPGVLRIWDLADSPEITGQPKQS